MLAALFFVGALGCTLAPTTAIMVVARFVLGLAVGGASVTVPVYLAEVSPAERRGALVARNELMIVSGQLLAFTFNAIIARVGGESGGVWRWMLVIATLPAVVLWFGMLVMPESPRWLASKTRFGEALDVLKQVRSQQRAEAELAEVSALAVREERENHGGWKDFRAAPWLRKLMFVGFGMGIAAVVLWLTNFVIGLVFPSLVSGFGVSNTFFLFVVAGIFSLTFVKLYVPETKGRTLETLEAELRARFS